MEREPALHWRAGEFVQLHARHFFAFLDAAVSMRDCAGGSPPLFWIALPMRLAALGVIGVLLIFSPPGPCPSSAGARGFEEDRLQRILARSPKEAQELPELTALRGTESRAREGAPFT